MTHLSGFLIFPNSDRTPLCFHRPTHPTETTLGVLLLLFYVNISKWVALHLKIRSTTTEPLYRYLWKSVSLHIFHQIFTFFRQNHCYQELFCLVMLLASSMQPQRWWKRENKENKQRAAHFLACFLAWLTLLNLISILIPMRSMQSSLIYKNLLDPRFINGYPLDYNFIGNTHTEAHRYLSSSSTNPVKHGSH